MNSPDKQEEEIFFGVNEVMEVDLDCLAYLRHSISSNSSNIPENYTDAIRRMYIRVLVTVIESSIARIRDEILEKASELEDGERSVLRDIVYELDDAGRVKERPLHAKLAASIKFSIASYCKVHKLEFLPDYAGTGWQSMLRLIKIRNRLTHPKSISDLVVSDEELGVSDQAEVWFRRTWGAMLHEHTLKLRIKLAVRRTELLKSSGFWDGLASPLRAGKSKD